MEHHGILGGPITCLLILDEETLFYGQGGYLCRSSLREDLAEERWRLMRDCDALHGVVHDSTDGRLFCFGGRELHRVTKSGEIISSTHTRDWILAVTVHDKTLFVGFLHTKIQLRCAKTLELQRTIATNGIFQTLYCMSLRYDDTDSIYAAAGTSHQSILVWGEDTSPKELVGHQGAIHAVRWNNNSTLVSASDDRTVRLWDLGTCSLVWTAYGHTARIWDVVLVGDRVISAGEDGTVRLWGASGGESLYAYRTNASVWRLAVFDTVVLAALNTGGITMLDLNIPWTHSIPVPDDRVAPIPGTNESLAIHAQKKETKTQKMTDQVVFGVSIVDKSTVLLATRSGSLWKMKDGYVESLPWKHAIPSDGSCMAVLGESIAMGTKTGLIQLHNGHVCDGSEHKSVQKLVWLDETRLIAFHALPGRATVWNIKHGGSCLVLRAAVNGIGLSCAHKSNHVVIGDTRGNVSLFDMSSTKTVPESEAVSILRKVHEKQHVTDMAWTNTHLYTVGNDGCLVMMQVNLANSSIISLLSLPLRNFTGLCNVWSLQNKIVVAGYLGNDFAILGVDDNQEYCRLDTGGRQRLLTLNTTAFSSQSVSEDITIAVLKRTDKGSNMLDVWHFGDSLREKANCRRFIGHMLHTETIFDASFFPITKDSFVLVTASEDCSTKLSVFKQRAIVAVKTLPCQSSGVRAVSTTTFRDGNTMIVTGGKLQLRFYFTSLRDGNLELRESGCSRPGEMLDIDHRVNAISTAQAEGSHKNCLVVCGTSSGMCYSLVFSDGCASPMIPFFQDKRPILSTFLLALTSDFLCFVGTSAGVMRVFRLSLDRNEGKLLSPLLSIASHSVGVNSIAAVLESECNQTIRIQVFSGGDDQAVVAHRINVNKSHDTIQLETSSRVENAGCSAIRSVALVGKDSFLSVGYDQQLKLWRWDTDLLVLSSVRSSSVGDVNCLAFCSSSSIAAVCGSGVETFRFLEEETEAYTSAHQR